MAKQTADKTGTYILSIVGVVAAVGLFTLFSGASSSGDSISGAAIEVGETQSTTTTYTEWTTCVDVLNGKGIKLGNREGGALVKKDVCTGQQDNKMLTYVICAEDVDGGYTYFASAKDKAGNENITEVRSAAIFIPPSVIDIYKTPGTPASGNMLAQGIAPDADNPITFGLTVLSFGGLSRIGSVRASFTSQFDSTVRGPSICTQASPTGNGANDFYYSCTINIRYFDPPGLWDVKAAVQDSSNSQWSADYIETFVLMSEKYLKNDPSISFGSVNPGAQNIENNLQIRNVGNDLISEIKLLGNDLVGESDNTKKIFLVDFAAKSSIGSCITGSAIGYIETTIPGFNLPRGDNSLGFGIADLYLCLKQAPFGTSQIYSAKGANAWQITYPPEG